MAEFIKTRYAVLGIIKEQNQYNKYLKFRLLVRLKGITEAEDQKLVPVSERQIIEEWYKTRKEAERQAEFYNTHFQRDWGNGSWAKLK